MFGASCFGWVFEGEGGYCCYCLNYRPKMEEWGKRITKGQAERKKVQSRWRETGKPGSLFYGDRGWNLA